MKILLVSALVLFYFQGFPMGENKKEETSKLEAKLRRYILNKDGHEKEHLKTFCDALVMEDMSDSAKVKVFTDWICDYLFYDMSYYKYKKSGGKVEREINWKTAVTSRLTVCAGYADLLCAMCETQNIDCRFVEGYAYLLGDVRSAVSITTAYLPQNFLFYFERHAWCMVTYDNGNSYLVDPTWIDNLGDYTFYQTDPFIFIASHYPDASFYQLINSPVTIGELTSIKINQIRNTHTAVKRIKKEITCR